MSKIRTPNELQDNLDNDFSWRLKEIADFRTAIRNSISIQERTLIRAGLAILYAHWEGFIKKSSESLLNYIANRNLRYKELQKCYISLGLRNQLNKLSSSESNKKNSEIISFLLLELDNPAKIPFKNCINTKSNLSSQVFDNIASSVGIETTLYQTKYNFIDESLLKRRNSIAHGEFLDVDINDYIELSDKVISLLRQYKNDVENLVVLKKYLNSA